MYEMVNFFLLPSKDLSGLNLGAKRLKITLQLSRSFFGFAALSN